MRETGLKRVWGRFGGPIWRISGKIGKCCQNGQKLGLENMEFDLFGVAVRPFELKTGANGSKSGQGSFGPVSGLFRDPWGPIGPMGAQMKKI